MRVAKVEEPIVKASIIVPEGITPPLLEMDPYSFACHIDYLGEMIDLCNSHRADSVDHNYLDAGDATETRIMINCVIPLSEIVSDFFDKLKSRSSGFASFE